MRDVVMMNARDIYGRYITFALRHNIASIRCLLRKYRTIAPQNNHSTYINMFIVYPFNVESYLSFVHLLENEQP